MTEDVFPFTLNIDCRNGQRMSVVCLDVLRAMERTRRVYDAQWDDRPVIAKVFIKPGKAWYHMGRESRAIRRLEARRLNTPRLLFCGRAPSGWAVVTEKIEGAVTALEAWTQTRTLEKKVDLVSRIGVELARQHNAGVVQTDLHFGNFLVKDDEVFLLDPATMRFRRDPVGRSRSMKQVARLACILPEQTAQSAIETVFRQYAAVREWPVHTRDVQWLCKAQGRSRQRAIKRGLQKSLRTNRRHEALRRDSWKGIADRAFLQKSSVDALTIDLDKATMDGQILKNGNTCSVSHTIVGGTEVVIKRYNHKGLLHSIRYTAKGSRAKNSWLNANRLSMIGILTPLPLAFVEEYRGPLLWRSYFIAEFVPGEELRDILASSETSVQMQRRARQMADSLIETLGAHRIIHGDLKHSNILITSAGPVITDLDAMVFDSCKLLYELKRRKEARRYAAEYRTSYHPRQKGNSVW